MQWRTTFETEPLPVPMTLSDHVLLLGSCFAENIGDLLVQYKFPALVNPSGILFHPLAIARSIEHGADLQIPSPETFFASAGTYRHFDFHSSLSHPELPVAVKQVREAVVQMHNGLQQSTHIIVSFGTAIVYEDVRTGLPVVNNHKLPADRFRKRMLSAEEIVQAWMPVMDRVESMRTVHWIFTISPVRHVKEGVVQNMHSKSILIDAVHRLAALRPRVHYFPAYELMMDDLRDYRFYAEDMLHPSPAAIQYIWERFCADALTQDARAWIDKWKPVLQALQHRPFFPDSPEHQAFMRSRYAVVAALQKDYPQLDLRSALEHFS